MRTRWVCVAMVMTLAAVGTMVSGEPKATSKPAEKLVSVDAPLAVARHFVAAIAAKDFEGLMGLVPRDQDLDWMIAHVKTVEKDPKKLQGSVDKLQRKKKYFARGLAEMRATKDKPFPEFGKGLDWSKARVTRAVSKLDTKKHGLEKVSIDFEVDIAGTHYYLQVDDCYKVGRGYITFSWVKFKGTHKPHAFRK